MGNCVLLCVVGKNEELKKTIIYNITIDLTLKVAVQLIIGLALLMNSHASDNQNL